MLESNLYDIRFQNLNQRRSVWEILTKSFFQKFFAPHDIVLDIGCGFGDFINSINCGKKIGLDIDRGYKKYLHQSVTFIHGTSSKIPLKNASVNKIFISNVFEHISKKDIVLTISECKRILKSGGQVIILQPNIRFSFKDYWMFFDHITPIDDRALDEIFFTNKFTLRKKVLKFLPYTTKSNFPKNPIFVKLYLKVPLLWRIFGKQSLIVYQVNK